MIKRLPLILVAFALMGCATGRTVSQEQVIPLVGEYKVHRWDMDNGLRLIFVEDHHSPTFAYQTWFKVGSRDEIPGNTGLAHLFEHMMFKETKTLKDGEYMKVLEAAGSDGLNAFTSHDYTGYIQQLPKEKLDLIAQLESERMINLKVNDKSFKTETDVVQNERRFRNENSPDGTMYQEMFGIAYTKHPYHWPVVGYQEDLDRMSGEDARKFYQSHYSPNNAVLIVVGDFEPGEVLSTIKKHYAYIPSQPVPTHTIEMEPVQVAARRKAMKLNIKVEKLMMGYHIPNVVSEDSAALKVLEFVLAGGKSSRLYRALVETGIATDIGAEKGEGKDPSLFMLFANLQKNKKATQAEAVILKELGKLQHSPISEEELARAKNKLKFNYYSSFDSNYEKARFIGTYEVIANGLEWGIRQNEKVATITAADIQAVAKRYFEGKNRTVITGVPK